MSRAAREAAASLRGTRLAALTRASWAVESVTGAKGEGLATGASAESASAAPGAGEDGREGEGAAETASQSAVRRVDAGAAWGSLVHGLLEHAMRHPASTRADLQRLALWLTVESEELRPVVAEALDLVEAVKAAPFWEEARAGGEVHVEVPFAVLEDATILHGIVDLVYRTSQGWRILDYKTDLAVADDRAIVARHQAQVSMYRAAWEKVTGQKVESAGIVPVRTLKPVWTS